MCFCQCIELPAGCKLPVVNLPTGQKSGFSPAVSPIHVKLGRADGHLGLLGCAKFHLNRHRGVGMWECGPQNINNFHFLVKSRPTGATPLTDFENFRDFYTPKDPTLAFQISYVIRITGYGVIAEKPRVRQSGQVFPCTLAGKTMRWIKNE